MCPHACMRLQVCATIAVQMRQRDSSLFMRGCSWCLASGLCHDSWHYHWLTSRTHCARQAPSRFFVSSSSLLHSLFFSLSSPYTHTYMHMQFLLGFVGVYFNVWLKILSFLAFIIFRQHKKLLILKGKALCRTMSHAGKQVDHWN